MKEGSVQETNLNLISQMAMVLTKMCMQNVDFCNYSPSVVVIASFYASTAFLKHSKKHAGSETNIFCSEVRKTIFSVLLTEQQILKSTNFREKQFINKLNKLTSDLDQLIANYEKQFGQENIE